jgi:hypothetical protein
MWDRVPVAHVYNPSHSGDRDQEDHSSKPAWANSSRDPILEKEKVGGVAQGVGSEFKPQYCKKVNKKIKCQKGVNLFHISSAVSL